MSEEILIWLEPQEPGPAISDIETSAEKQALLFSVDSNLLSPSRWKMRHSVFPVEGPFFYYNMFFTVQLVSDRVKCLFGESLFYVCQLWYTETNPARLSDH
jgi:hypothetical protein